MRWTVIFFFLILSLAHAQEKTDTIIPPPVEPDRQVALPWNGTLITAMENPAFAGFDRRLQFGYSYEGEKLNIPEGYDTRKAGFWNQTAIVDFAFGGGRKNIGVNISYNGGQRLITDYHRIQVAHSYRFHLKDHRFILGLGVRYLKLKGGEQTYTYGDMIDPRYGFVYQTNEFYGPDSVQFAEYSAGLIYSWKQLFFGYAFRYEHRSLLTPAGKDFHPVHHLHANYSLDFFAAGQMAAGFTAEYNGFNWYMEPAILVMWKQLLFINLSTPDLKQFKTEVGLQVWRFRAVYSFAFYFDQYATETLGVASMSGGLRYHFNPFTPKRK